MNVKAYISTLLSSNRSENPSNKRERLTSLLAIKNLINVKHNRPSNLLYPRHQDVMDTAPNEAVKQRGPILPPLF